MWQQTATYQLFVQQQKKIETDEEPTKQEIVSNLRKGFEEMDLIKKGKLKTTSLNDFLNEL